MCLPLYIDEMDLSIDEIVSRMEWERREVIEDLFVMPYGLTYSYSDIKGIEII